MAAAVAAAVVVPHGRKIAMIVKQVVAAVELVMVCLLEKVEKVEMVMGDILEVEMVVTVFKVPAMVARVEKVVIMMVKHAVVMAEKVEVLVETVLMEELEKVEKVIKAPMVKVDQVDQQETGYEQVATKFKLMDGRGKQWENLVLGT